MKKPRILARGFSLFMLADYLFEAVFRAAGSVQRAR